MKSDHAPNINCSALHHRSLTILSMGYVSIIIIFTALCVSAAAVLGEYLDVIPGPGLPSLRSLNLTLADFREMPIPGMPMPAMPMHESSISKPDTFCGLLLGPPADKDR